MPLVMLEAVAVRVEPLSDVLSFGTLVVLRVDVFRLTILIRAFPRLDLRQRERSPAFPAHAVQVHFAFPV